MRRTAVLASVLASSSAVLGLGPVPTEVSVTPLPTTYTYSATANTATAGLTPPYGAIYDARTWPINEIAIITGKQVNYVESAFEDNFACATATCTNSAYFINGFNLTRWMPTGSLQSGTAATITTPWGATAQGASQDHCPAAGAVGAASPGTCTLLSPSSLQTNVDLTKGYGYTIDPNAYGGDTGRGAVMTLSQKSCYDAFGNNVAACCTTSTLKNGQKTQVCASWAGTHLSSFFGAQYGILETEAAFNYMYGGTIPTGATAVDQSWNEIDELILNQNTGGAAGYTYGSSLFVSKPSPATASQPYGYGAYGSAGLFANHDSTGHCTLNSQCTAAQCSSSECNAGAMCCPTSTYGTTDMSKVNGYPSALSGNSLGGTVAGVPQTRVPTFGSPANNAVSGYDATKYHNYKLVWTPKWLAWMIDNTVMRNESVDMGRQTIPWRPVTLRPLIRTNNGSAPLLCGTMTNAAHNAATNPLVCVPSGGIYSTADGGLIANNTITSLTAKTATVKLLPAQVSSTTDAEQAVFYTTSTSFWSYPSNCIPCNLLSSASTTGVALTLVEKTLYNAELQFWDDSSVAVRRTKYTPYNAEAVAAAVSQVSSWASTNTVAYNVVTGAVPAPTATTTPSPPAAGAYELTMSVQLNGPSTATFDTTDAPAVRTMLQTYLGASCVASPTSILFTSETEVVPK